MYIYIYIYTYIHTLVYESGPLTRDSCSYNHMWNLTLNDFINISVREKKTQTNASKDSQ